MPTYTSQKFQNKTRFYLYFFDLCVGLLFSKKKNEIFVIKKNTKIWHLSDARIRKKHIKKFQKNIAEGNRVKRALTELPIVFLVLYQKRLNGH